jgi:hypothetical protein
METVVRGFSRYHKYSIGADLRESTMTVARYAHRAWRDQGRRGEWINRLVFAVDDLKLSMQIAKRVQAFRSFSQFEALVRIISDLGRQCGGWQNKHPKGQNDQARTPDRRAQILSARDASQGANP